MNGKTLLLLTGGVIAVLAFMPGNPVSAFLGNQNSFSLLQALHPDLFDLATNSFNQASAQLPAGVTLQVNSTFRSFDKQNVLFQSGETNTPAGHSFHNYGLALDMQLTGVPDWKNDPNWQTVVNVFKNAGFRWGGDFADYDPVHFDYGFGYTTDQLLQLYNAGNFIPGTNYVNLNQTA